MGKAPVENASLAGVEPLPSGNIEFGWDREHERLVVFIDCSPAARAAATPSTTGKTRLLATTRGFVRVASPVAGLKVNMHVSLPSDPYLEGTRRAVASERSNSSRAR